MLITNILKRIQKLHREGHDYEQRIVLTASLMLKVTRASSGATELYLFDNSSTCTKLTASLVVPSDSDIITAYNRLIGDAVMSERKRFTAVANELNGLFLV